MTELSRIPEQSRDEPSLSDLLQHIDPTFADLIVVEGFKQEPIPKIEVYRPNLNKPMLSAHDSHIIAIACDEQVITELPQLDLNNPDEIADFILQWLKQQSADLKLVSSR